MRSVLLFVIASHFSYEAAFGCPQCGGEIRKKVWAGILDEHFGYNALVMTLPFLLSLALVAAIYWSGPVPVARK